MGGSSKIVEFFLQLFDLSAICRTIWKCGIVLGRFLWCL